MGKLFSKFPTRSDTIRVAKLRRHEVSKPVQRRVISGKLVQQLSKFTTIYKLSMSQKNGNIQILCTRTVSSEPSVFAETEKIENPQNLRWLQMLSSPITDRAMRMFMMLCT